jgi:hypothetical protein
MDQIIPILRSIRSYLERHRSVRSDDLVTVFAARFRTVDVRDAIAHGIETGSLSCGESQLVTLCPRANAA